MGNLETKELIHDTNEPDIDNENLKSGFLRRIPRSTTEYLDFKTRPKQENKWYELDMQKGIFTRSAGQGA